MRNSVRRLFVIVAIALASLAATHTTDIVRLATVVGPGPLISSTHNTVQATVVGPGPLTVVGPGPLTVVGPGPLVARQA
jgi:hypothetical protein